MVKNKTYRDGYDMGTMVDRVVYWWARYKGTRTEDGKDYSKFDLNELILRLQTLSMNPDSFKINKPSMGADE